MKAVYCTKMVGLINRMSEFRPFIASETGLLSDRQKLWNTVVIPEQQAALNAEGEYRLERDITKSTGTVKLGGIMQSPL